jgi:hypothetical protein
MSKPYNSESEDWPWMHYNMVGKLLAQAEWAGEIDALSVYRAFEHISDGRHKRGVRYSVALILTLIVLGKVTGMTRLSAIAEWVRWRADWLRQVLPGAREQFPCTATYSNVVRAVEAEQVIEMLASLLTRLEAARRCGSEPSRLHSQPEAREQHVQVAKGGKTLRGTLAHAAPEEGELRIWWPSMRRRLGWSWPNRPFPIKPMRSAWKHPSSLQRRSRGGF